MKTLHLSQRCQIIEVRLAKFVAFAKRIMGNLQDAEDAVQTAWLKVLFYDKPLASETDVVCVMYVALRNVCYANLRSRRRFIDLPEGTYAVAASERPDFDTPLECEALLRVLDDRSRRILILRHIIGLSEREVAAEMGIEPGYVGVLALRARRKLQGNAHRD